MEVPLELNSRNMAPSDAIEARVRERVEKLERYFGCINSCRVVVEAPHWRQYKGKLYHLRIDIGVSGREIVVNRVPHDRHAREDVNVAIRDPFDAAARQLEDHSRKAAGRVKAYEVSPHGKDSALHAYDGYGFVTSADGQEVYFHKNAVVNGAFKRIAIGDEVRVALIEGESDKGPQATTVIPIGKHHLAGR